MPKVPTVDVDDETLERAHARLDELEDEGTRSFAVLLQAVDEGALHAELGEAVQHVTKELSKIVDLGAKNAKGTLTLKLSFDARANGTITLTGDVTTKTPKPVRGGSVFWATKGNNLSPENPRQQKLPLREVPASQRRTKELPAEDRPARSI